MFRNESNSRHLDPVEDKGVTKKYEWGQLWILNCSERDTRTVGDCWDDGEHTHQQDEEKWTSGAQRNGSHLGELGRWIRTAIAVNTGDLLLTSWSSH